MCGLDTKKVFNMIQSVTWMSTFTVMLLTTLESVLLIYELNLQERLFKEDS